MKGGILGQPANATSGLVNNLDGQSVKALIDEFLQCIIHKPVARHAALARKHRTGNADPKMSPKTQAIRTSVPRMSSTLVEYFQMARLQYFPESAFKFMAVHR